MREPGKKFRTITVKGKQLGREIEIRLMPDGLFFAKLDGTRYEDKVLVELEKKLKAVVLESEKLTFKKVIVFELEPQYASGNYDWNPNGRAEKWIRGFKFDFEVWEVSDQKNANRYRVARKWEHDTDGILKPKGDYRQEYWNDQEGCSIDFTEQRFENLMLLRTRIIELYEELERVLGKGAGDALARILDQHDVTKLLAAG